MKQSTYKTSEKNLLRQDLNTILNNNKKKTHNEMSFSNIAFLKKSFIGTKFNKICNVTKFFAPFYAIALLTFLYREFILDANYNPLFVFNNTIFERKTERNNNNKTVSISK